MKQMKPIFLTMAAAAVIALGGCSNAENQNSSPEVSGSQTEAEKLELEDAEYTFVAATPVSVDSVNHYIVHKAKELMEEKSNGRVTINIFEAGQLGNDREVIEGMQSGTIDFYITNSATFVPFVPRSGIFDMPNIFPNLEIARKVLDGPIVQEVVPDYEAAGFKMFGFSDGGFRQTTSNKIFETLEDFKGLKIRTMQNPYHLAYWNALGTAPTPMDMSEVYIGLQQGAIDAQENPYDIIVGNKLYETQKYITETNHFIHALTMMTSKTKYDSLPDDIKVIVEESVKEALLYGRQIADERMESRKEIVLDSGVEIRQMSPELYEEIINSIQPVYDMMREEIGADLVDMMLEEVEKAEKEME